MCVISVAFSREVTSRTFQKRKNDREEGSRPKCVSLPWKELRSRSSEADTNPVQYSLYRHFHRTCLSCSKFLLNVSQYPFDWFLFKIMLLVSKVSSNEHSAFSLALLSAGCNCFSTVFYFHFILFFSIILTLCTYEAYYYGWVWKCS